MDAHTQYADRFRKLAECAESIDQLLLKVSSEGALSLQDLHSTITPRESAELNLSLIHAIIALLKSNMAYQGVDVTKHAVNAESKRLESYISRLSVGMLGEQGNVSASDSDSN